MRLPNLESRVFLALLFATTVFFVWMVRGFLQPIFWAAVFAILFRPFYAWLLLKLRGRQNTAAALATVTVVLVVVVPFSLLLTALARQALSLYQRILTGQVNLNAPLEFIERTLPAIIAFLERYGVQVGQVRSGIENAAVSGTQYVATRALALGQNALTTTILFILMLYLLYFFFRDGERIIEAVIRAMPMGDARERRLMEKFADVSRATVKGTLVVAAAQGALGGIMFALVGIQAALFWGVIMGVLSLLPAVGPALVWIPAAIILLATGEIFRGLVVVAGGTLVVGLVDNLLRPALVGRQTQMPDYLVLLTTLGGLTVFGLAGFVAGPIVAALFLVMWNIFADEYAPLDDAHHPVAGEPLPGSAEAAPRGRGDQAVELVADGAAKGAPRAPDTHTAAHTDKAVEADTVEGSTDEGR